MACKCSQYALAVSCMIFVSLSVSETLAEKQDFKLGNYISDFRPLVYSPVEVGKRHSITKRSLYDKDISLQLKYGDRKFDLSLYPSEDETFHANADLVVDGVATKFDQSHLVSGHIKGDADSSVYGSVIAGVFQGQLTTGDGEVFYVDRKQYHPKHPLTSGDVVHSVIYKKDDVDVEKFYDEQRVKRDANKPGSCGLTPFVHKWMDRVENSYLEEDKPTEGRKKRALTSSKNTCNLYLQSDPELWQHIKDQLQTTKEEVIIQEISSLFRDLVREVEGIYRNEFNVEFRIDRLQINKTCVANEHWFCEKNLDVSNFLNMNTYTNHDAYCLAYILTYRDFADGTLGLAWVAKSGSSNGGICSKWKNYQENGSARKKSLNTGIVTTKNYGERVPKLMSQLTLAHELGHNFGSEHDPVSNSPSCAPYKDSENPLGNYIMYYAAISGKRDNNNNFSPCSVTNITKVLENSNTDCFVAKTGSWCGNQIVESSEECDCGYKDTCSCCVPQNSLNSVAGACKRTLGSACDPSEGPCCATSCRFESNVACSAQTECAQEARCNGGGAECPAAVPINNVPCNDNTQVCNNTECSGSVCSLIGAGWKECSLSSEEASSAAALCYVSCADPSGTCFSSYDEKSALPADFQALLTSYGDSNGKISAKPGQMCNKDQGFCDYFQSCRNVLDLGPLARLKGLLLSFSSVENLREWLKTNWWIPVLSFVGLVIFMTLLIIFGTVFTPSSNPNRSKNRKITTPFTKPPRAAGPTIGGRRRDEMEMR